MPHQLAPQACADLDDIWLYVARESGNLDIADRLIDTISQRFLLLAAHPYLGRPRDEDFGIGTRSFAVGDYVIVYWVQDNDVAILRVVHGRRELEELFG